MTSDRDGKFEIRGVGRDRIAVLRVISETTATHEVNVVTRKIERFTGRGTYFGQEDTFLGTAPILVAAPVPVTTGRVTDAVTGKALPGTVLWVERLYQRGRMVMGLKAVADKDGRFTLPGLPQGNQAPGDYRLPAGGRTVPPNCCAGPRRSGRAGARST